MTTVLLLIALAGILMESTPYLGGMSYCIHEFLMRYVLRLVGGLEVLAEMERVPTDKNDKPMVCQQSLCIV